MSDVLPAVKADVAALSATTASLLAIKKQYTDLLTVFTANLNANMPRKQLLPSWQTCVNKYNELTVQTNNLKIQFAQLEADFAPAVHVYTSLTDGTTAPPPLPDGTTPNGGAALPPMGTVRDASGDVWSFGANAGGEDFHVLRNGLDFQGNMACLITIYNGAIWTRDSLNNWWTRDATGKLVTSLMAPYGVNPLNVRSFNTHDGSTIVASAANTYPNAGAFLVDMNAGTWRFGPTAANGKDFVITRNGLPFSEPGFTTKPYEALMMRLKNGVVWLQNAAGSWVYPPV